MKGKSRRRFLLYGLAGVAVALAAAWLWGPLGGAGARGDASAATAGIVNVGPKEAWTLLQRDPTIVLVDVRTPREYAAGHLKGAMNVELDRLEALAPSKLADRNAHFFVYCHSGRRSSFAVDILQHMGYTHLVNLVGGISAWSQDGYPVVLN